MGTASRPRLSVFRSNTGISAQIIDDLAGKTLVSFSSKELGLKGYNVEASTNVGLKLAEKALANGISSVVLTEGGIYIMAILKP